MAARTRTMTATETAPRTYALLESLERRALMAATVESFTLIDAATDREVMTLQAGATLNLATLPSRKLNVRANVAGGASAVEFRLDGSQRRMEKSAPFALAGDADGDYRAWTPAVGNHTLTATAYAGSSKGAELSVAFKVVDQAAHPTPQPEQPPASTGPRVTRFVLVNADTDKDVMTLTDGATLDRSKLPRNLTVRAETAGTVASVRFALDGNASYRTEGTAPYSLAGDRGGDMKAWNLADGTHRLQAVAMGGGATSAAHAVTFRIVANQTAPTPEPQPDPTPTPNPTPTPPPAPKPGVYRASDGMIVMEAENQGVPAAWSLGTSLGGYTGDAYVLANRDAGGGGTGTITFKFYVEEAGNYELRWRSRISTGTDQTEHNDSFVSFPTGKDVPGEWALGDWTKTYMNVTGAWTWKTSTKDHDPRPLRQYFSAGEHTMKVSVRSAGHAIDRVVLFKYDEVTFNDGAFTAAPESAKA